MPTDQTPGFFQSRYGFEAQHFKQTAKPTSFRQAKVENFAECLSDPFRANHTSRSRSVQSRSAQPDTPEHTQRRAPHLFGYDLPSG
jgi:hypothetical protein